MEIIDLPHDVFLLVLAQLSARTTVRCRRVSKRWKAAFTDPDLSLQLLKWHFPRCREIRMKHAAAGGDISGGEPGGHPPTDSLPLQDNQMLGGEVNRQVTDWTTTFAQVARRYHHLRTATPRSVSKVRLGTSGSGPGHPQDRFYGVAPWDRYLRLDDKTAPFHYPDPSWCYSQDEGLLVYHAHPDDARRDVPAARSYVYPWRLLDLASGEEYEVPFPYYDDKIVRRVRLFEGVLLFEWCEREAYHQLNDREECHRHYATVLDVARTLTPAAHPTAGWTVTPRAEVKFHFLGLPLNTHDRFLSAHTKTHYAVYVWQPNRSPWGEDDPIETVIIWNITESPPRVVRRMTWATLAFYGVRQRLTPRLRGLGMDERNLYFVEEEHRWAQGGHSSLSPPRVHLVSSTGIPVVPGPLDRSLAPGLDDPGGDDPKYRDDDDEVSVQGPCWLDQCGANGDVNISFCSRAYSRPDTPPSLAHHHEVPVTSPGIWNGALHPVKSTPTLSHEIAAAIGASAARWPGWAPCWRHEEFPYLTVSEMVDFRAGVRVTARHCFMLETLSVHVRPSLSVRGLGGGGVVVSPATFSGDVDDEGGVYWGSADDSVGSRLNERLGIFDRDTRTAGADRRGKEATYEEYEDSGGETQFADGFWDELLGKGFVCGDERWLIGEDRSGLVTIVRF